jgi:hypothetical protein
MGAPAETPVDSLYIAGLAEDVLRSCRARLARDLDDGLRITVLTLFAPLAGAALDALAREGIDVYSAGLPNAAERHPGRRPLDALVAEPNEVDEDCLARASAQLLDLGGRTRATQVYAPLGVGGHPDRRMAHDAARNVFRSGGGRDVFFYEERPEALLHGAVRVRLAQIGARLPPAAADAAEKATLLRFMLRFHVGPSSRGEIRGAQERLRALPLAARFWRDGQSWQPQRSRGPRLQPVVWELAAHTRFGGAPPRDRRADALEASYGRRLNAGTHAERYWLLLPPLAGDNWEELPLAAGA